MGEKPFTTTFLTPKEQRYSLNHGMSTCIITLSGSVLQDCKACDYPTKDYHLETSVKIEPTTIRTSSMVNTRKQLYVPSTTDQTFQPPFTPASSRVFATQPIRLSQGSKCILGLQKTILQVTRSCLLNTLLIDCQGNHFTQRKRLRSTLDRDTEYFTKAHPDLFNEYMR